MDKTTALEKDESRSDAHASPQSKTERRGDDEEQRVAHDHAGEHHHHPSVWAYVKIAVVLSAVTALEVFTYFRSVFDWGTMLVPALLLMMVLKFYLVAMWFMHLRSDSRIFSKLFIAGLVLAVGVYIATLATFEFWS